eukprot:scaffold137306_cov19-Prasinocladus_malaysianus.AAC.2
MSLVVGVCDASFICVHDLPGALNGYVFYLKEQRSFTVHSVKLVEHSLLPSQSTLRSARQPKRHSTCECCLRSLAARSPTPCQSERTITHASSLHQMPLPAPVFAILLTSVTISRARPISMASSRFIMCLHTSTMLADALTRALKNPNFIGLMAAVMSLRPGHQPPRGMLRLIQYSLRINGTAGTGTDVQS